MNQLFVTSEIESKAFFKLGISKIKLIDSENNSKEGVLYEQILNCLRDNHKINVSVQYMISCTKDRISWWAYTLDSNKTGQVQKFHGQYNSYNEAMNNGILSAFLWVK